MEYFNLFVNEHERNAIVNALAYYDIMHSYQEPLCQDAWEEREREREQWKHFFKEDIASLGSPDGVDKLAMHISRSTEQWT